MALHKFRPKYWSNTNLAKWIYKSIGIKKPSSATFDGWYEWETSTQKKHPIIYWIVETALDKIQSAVYLPYDIVNTFLIWFHYRFIKRTHLVETTLKKGDYHSVEEQIMFTNFQILVDFVECEKASMQLWCHKDAKRPWYMRTLLRKFCKYRNPEYGLEYLNWEANLGDEGGEHQVSSAIEILKLYDWWKNVRPKRVDPFVASGLKEFYEKSDAELEKAGPMRFLHPKTDEEKFILNEMTKIENELMESYDKEDTDMLIRLITIRRDLWT